jgi:hypothetical protein
MAAAENRGEFLFCEIATDMKQEQPVHDEDEEERKPPLARWADIAQPASVLTKTGDQRFAIAIKLPEKSPKTASKFVAEMNDALKNKIAKTRGCELAVTFILVDSERLRLQRATASFTTFKDARTCYDFLKELGLPVNDMSAELEDFGNNRYDPWHESIKQSWWPWLAALRNPAPEMPMMQVTNRLDLTEGAKYKEGASGKLGKPEEVDRDDSPVPEEEPSPKKRKRSKKRKDESEEE